MEPANSMNKFGLLFTKAHTCFAGMQHCEGGRWVPPSCPRGARVVRLRRCVNFGEKASAHAQNGRAPSRL